MHFLIIDRLRCSDIHNSVFYAHVTIDKNVDIINISEGGGL